MSSDMADVPHSSRPTASPAASSAPLPDANTQRPDRPTTTAIVPAAASRDRHGRFASGASGNPAGVQKLGELMPRRKQAIIALKENLEFAVRGPAGPLSADRVCQIVRKMCDLAMKGDVKAARLILGLAIGGNTAEDKSTAPPSIVIKVENATFSAVKETASREQPPIDGEFTEKP